MMSQNSTIFSQTHCGVATSKLVWCLTAVFCITKYRPFVYECPWVLCYGNLKITFQIQFNRHCCCVQVCDCLCRWSLLFFPFYFVLQSTWALTGLLDKYRWSPFVDTEMQIQKFPIMHNLIFSCVFSWFHKYNACTWVSVLSVSLATWLVTVGMSNMWSFDSRNSGTATVQAATSRDGQNRKIRHLAPFLSVCEHVCKRGERWILHTRSFCVRRAACLGLAGIRCCV